MSELGDGGERAMSDEWQDVWDSIDEGHGCPANAAKRLLERLRDQDAELTRLRGVLARFVRVT